MCGIFFFSFLNAQSEKVLAEGKKTTAYFKVKDPKFNFGFVKQGTVVKIEYDFQNTGTEPLIISNIEVSCGCTVADFPHYPIKPGESSIVLITFNTKEKYDRQDRTVEVISNAANSPTKLRFKGVVLENKSEKETKK
jgi:hypothetical protein